MGWAIVNKNQDVINALHIHSGLNLMLDGAIYILDKFLGFDTKRAWNLLQSWDEGIPFSTSCFLILKDENFSQWQPIKREKKKGNERHYKKKCITCSTCGTWR